MAAVLSRRGVLGAGAVAAGLGLASGGLPAVASTDAGSSRPSSSSSDEAATASSPPDPLTPVRSLFAGREGAVYTGASQWSEHRLVLSTVGDIPGAGDVEHRFRVAFTTDDGARDGIYRLVQDGELIASLFLARVTDAPLLEAIVDRGEGAA